MLDSPTLVDHNMVCGSNKDQRDHFPWILFRDISDMYPYFPFDPPMQSDTHYTCTLF